MTARTETSHRPAGATACRDCGVELRWLPTLAGSTWPFETPLSAELVAPRDQFGIKRRRGAITAVPLDGRRAPGGLVLRRHNCPERRHHVPRPAAA